MGTSDTIHPPARLSIQLLVHNIPSGVYMPVDGGYTLRVCTVYREISMQNVDVAKPLFDAFAPLTLLAIIVRQTTDRKRIKSEFTTDEARC